MVGHKNKGFMNYPINYRSRDSLLKKISNTVPFMTPGWLIRRAVFTNAT